MLKILDVEGAVARDGSRWVVLEETAWHYDSERYAQITGLRRAEQQAMAAFGTDGRCLMRALQEELDDPEPADCGRCSVCAGPRFAESPDPRLVEEALQHLRSRPLRLEQRKMSPDAGGTMRKIPPGVLIEPGYALARRGDGGWWPAIERGLREGRLDAAIVVALADAVRSSGARPAWLTHVPSVANTRLVEELATALAAELGVPQLHLLERCCERPPQREMENAAQQAANVRGAFSVVASPPAGTGLLVDDQRFSGFTLAMLGGQLRQVGAEAIVPVTLATLG
jgi:ATP-dependent DNA helicase RecQ